MSVPIFDSGGRARLGACYPSEAAALAHGLAGHPLLSLEALAELGRRLDPAHLRSNMADLPIEVDPRGVHRASPDADAIIRAIEENGSWMVLRHIQNAPPYAALLDAMAAELAPIVAPTTGRMLNVDGLIFVASPNAVTPFHFDPEYNILMQIMGTKVMHLFPAFDEAVASEESHENLHLRGHMNLPWRDEIAASGRAFELTPGAAVYVPYKAPHWVKNGPGVSVSLSITWHSEWSFAEADARMMNRKLRQWGLTPRAPRPYPARNLAKSLSYRAIRRLSARSAISTEG
jgi:mannose-6-phosphate isomerase-like protein (cupin superfamily)